MSKDHEKVDGIVESTPNWEPETEFLVLVPTQRGCMVLGKSLYRFLILK